MNEPKSNQLDHSCRFLMMMDPSLEDGVLGFIGIEFFRRDLTPRGSGPKKHVKDFSVNCLNGDINDNFLRRFNYFSFSLALSLSLGHRQLHNFSAASPKSFFPDSNAAAQNGNAKENFLSSCYVEWKKKFFRSWNYGQWQWTDVGVIEMSVNWKFFEIIVLIHKRRSDTVTG